jgi:hypothetical protein
MGEKSCLHNKTGLSLPCESAFDRILDHKDQLLTALSIHRVDDDTHTTLLETIRLGLVAGIYTESNGTTEAATLRNPGHGT